MLRSNAIAVLSTFLLFQTSAAINACPVTDTVFSGTQGIRYRVCPDTDLIGESQSVTHNVASTTACAQLCDRAINCFKAVYDTQTKACHIKGTGDLNWQPNARFDVIQAERINIARCPYTETTYTYDGVSDLVCRRLPQLTICSKASRFAPTPTFGVRLWSSSTGRQRRTVLGAARTVTHAWQRCSTQSSQCATSRRTRSRTL
jgi:hypothetical protein